MKGLGAQQYNPLPVYFPIGILAHRTWEPENGKAEPDWTPNSSKNMTHDGWFPGFSSEGEENTAKAESLVLSESYLRFIGRYPHVLLVPLKLFHPTWKRITHVTCQILIAFGLIINLGQDFIHIFFPWGLTILYSNLLERRSLLDGDDTSTIDLMGSKSNMIELRFSDTQFQGSGIIRRAPGILKCLFVLVYGKPSILFVFLETWRVFFGCVIFTSELEINYTPQV